jgi:hypothetical protein
VSAVSLSIIEQQLSLRILSGFPFSALSADENVFIKPGKTVAWLFIGFIGSTVLATSDC